MTHTLLLLCTMFFQLLKVTYLQGVFCQPILIHFILKDCTGFLYVNIPNYT